MGRAAGLTDATTSPTLGVACGARHPAVQAQGSCVAKSDILSHIG